jgi:DNA repair exonuclease SbcCD nuclease subunit
MISFFHAADLHLGLRVTRFSGDCADKIRGARFRALDNLIKLAAKRQVQFLLIAGDLFDDLAVDGITAERAFHILDAAPLPVYVLPGNHDPLLPGGVWDRKPWNTPSPRQVRLLRSAEPVPIGRRIMLFPCPVLRKTSLTDPTAWIAQAAVDGADFRIGVAHGSLKIHEDLPPDDHLISRTAARDLKLDYLALGHWHRRQFFPDADGALRTAYSGVHEPMRFGGGQGFQTGWHPYSSGTTRNEFLDAGVGEILWVRIDHPGAPPEITSEEVGHLTWCEEERALVSEDDLSQLIADVAVKRPLPERQLLRLKLTGVLDAGAMLRLEELRQVLKERYLLGMLDTSGLHVQPREEEIREAAGQGVLRHVLGHLLKESVDPKREVNSVAERALVLLYQIAKEVES